MEEETNESDQDDSTNQNDNNDDESDEETEINNSITSLAVQYNDIMTPEEAGSHRTYE